MRQQLTYHKLPLKKTVIAGSVVLFCYFYIISRPEHDGVTGIEIFLMLCMVMATGVFFISLIPLFAIWTQKRKLEFDETNMYLIRNGKESSVPLKNILEISMTGSRIKASRLWYDYRIEFIDDFNEIVYISFLHPNGRGELHLFQENVRQQNPTVKISNWASSLDPFINIFKKRK